MPSEVCDLLDKDPLVLSSLTSDCTPDPTTGLAELECSCCTFCTPI